MKKDIPACREQKARVPCPIQQSIIPHVTAKLRGATCGGHRSPCNAAGSRTSSLSSSYSSSSSSSFGCWRQSSSAVGSCSSQPAHTFAAAAAACADSAGSNSRDGCRRRGVSGSRGRRCQRKRQRHKRQPRPRSRTRARRCPPRRLEPLDRRPLAHRGVASCHSVSSYCLRRLLGLDLQTNTRIAPFLTLALSNDL